MPYAEAMTGEQFPHDASYKKFFSDPEMVRSLLASFIPADFIAELDLQKMERCPGSYVTDDLRERRSDIVWRIGWKNDRWCYLILMLEFQSTMDRWMALRVLSYTALFLLDLTKTDEVKESKVLPPVFPVVIYNGGAAWTAPLDVSELFGPMPDDLRKYSPSLRHFLLDEGRVSQKDLPEDNLVSLLIALEKADGVEQVGDVVKRLLDRLKDDRYLDLRHAFAEWLSRVVVKRMGVPDDLSGIHELEEMNAMLEENIDRWKDKYVQQGRDEAMREVAARMLRGSMPKSEVASYFSMTAAELDKLLAQASPN